MRTVQVGPTTVLPAAAALLLALSLLARAQPRGARSPARSPRCSPGRWSTAASAVSASPARRRQPGHPGPRRADARHRRPGRAVVERAGAPDPGRGPGGRRADHRPRRRPAGPHPGPGDAVRRGVRHGDRRVPDPRAQRVRRPRGRPVGAPDRAGALPAAARRRRLALADRADPAAPLGQGGGRRPGHRARPSSPPTCSRAPCPAPSPLVALALLVESFGHQAVVLWRLRRDRRRHPLAARVGRSLDASRPWCWSGSR